MIKEFINKLKREKQVKQLSYNITYGTVLKAYITDKDDIDTVMLVNNISAGDGFNCLVLDLITKEVISDCKDINDFKATYQIIEVVGQFNELFKEVI